MDAFVHPSALSYTSAVMLRSASWRIALIFFSGLLLLATTGVGLVGWRAITVFGPDSPLSYHPATRGVALSRALDDLGTSIRWRLRGWLGSSVVMENHNQGVMIPNVTAAELESRPVATSTTRRPPRILGGLLGREDFIPKLGESIPLPPPDRWSAAGGGLANLRYSTDEQLTPASAPRLKLIAEVDSSELGEWAFNSESSPMKVGDKVFWLTADEHIMACRLDGSVLWSFHLPAFGYARRGFTAHSEGANVTLFVPFDTFIVALDGATGALVERFGDRGVAKIPGPSVTGPVIHAGALHVAVYDPQLLVALDLASGKELWRLPIHPEGRTFRGGAMWGGMALDPGRNRLFVSTGNPRPALTGIHRPGPNEGSNSVLAIDLNERKVAWRFQEVRHDLWDFDIPAGPVLTTIDAGGRRWDVVTTVTKIGNTLILDRDRGEPLFDFRLVPTVPSTMTHEKVAPYNPHLETPEPLIDIEFDLSMVTDVSEAARKSVMHQLADGKAAWGRYVPPALNQDVITFGLHGGAEWHGAAINPRTQKLFVPVNMIPWALRLYLSAKSPEPPELEGRALYDDKCAGCHAANRDGIFDSEGEVAVEFIPALHGYSFKASGRAAFEPGRFARSHPELEGIGPEDLEAMWSLFQAWDRVLAERGELVELYHWRQLTDPDGRPASKPPWGKIVALDLRTGKIDWEVRHGEKTIDGEVRKTGSPSYGGLTINAGGVIMAGGTDDRLVRALSQETGEELWRYEMAAAGSAPPIIVEHEGRPYVLVVSSGGKFHTFVDQASRLYIFSLEPEGG